MARGETAQVNHREGKWIEGHIRISSGIARREEKARNEVEIKAPTVAVQVQVGAVPAVFAAAVALEAAVVDSEAVVAGGNGFSETR